MTQTESIKLYPAWFYGAQIPLAVGLHALLMNSLRQKLKVATDYDRRIVAFGPPRRIPWFMLRIAIVRWDLAMLRLRRPDAAPTDAYEDRLDRLVKYIEAYSPKE